MLFPNNCFALIKILLAKIQAAKQIFSLLEEYNYLAYFPQTERLHVCILQKKCFIVTISQKTKNSIYLHTTVKMWSHNIDISLWLIRGYFISAIIAF